MIFLFLILGIIIVVLVSYIHWFQNYSRVAGYIKKFPSIGPLMPVIGHVWDFSRDPVILFQQFRRRHSQFEETFAYWGGTFPTLNIVTADDAEIILSNVKYIKKGRIYEFLYRWLRTGLLTSTGKKWHRRRKMLTPAFHYKILEMFIEAVGEHCENFTEILQKECHKDKTNIYPLITKLTLSIICETSMGIKLEQSDNTLLSEYYKALYSISDIYIKRSTSPWLYPQLIYYLTPYNWRELKIVNYLHKFTSNIIDSKEKVFNEEYVADLESTDKKSKSRLAMLDLLLYKKRLGQISDRGIREEVDTFVFEGHDTTSAGISMALFTIANHKDVQEKIFSELDDIFGDSNRHATYDDLQNMKYLECCLKECLRLYPPVSHIVREIEEDVQLTHHVAPAGSQIWIFIYDIHRNAKYFPDPENFDPDRFLPENSTGRNPFAYIPFSAGPRNCIGQKFAVLELKSVVSSILRNFVLEPVDTPKDLEFMMDLVLRVKGPINIRFKSRKFAR